ncbi:MAG: hypothetical protein KDK28_14470, partial [Maritimibacter sp.]|nr:hypothetical protein [Maritimibacter sp.]
MTEPFSHRPRPVRVAVVGTMMAYYAPIIGPAFRDLMAGHVTGTTDRLGPASGFEVTTLGHWAEDADTDGIARALGAEDFDVLLIVPAMCTPPAAIAALARASGLPVVIAGAHELTSVGAEYDMRALCRHSVNVGVSMMGAMLRRTEGVPPILVSGWLDDA